MKNRLKLVVATCLVTLAGASLPFNVANASSGWVGLNNYCSANLSNSRYNGSYASTWLSGPGCANSNPYTAVDAGDGGPEATSSTYTMDFDSGGWGSSYHLGQIDNSYFSTALYY